MSRSRSIKTALAALVSAGVLGAVGVSVLPAGETNKPAPPTTCFDNVCEIYGSTDALGSPFSVEDCLDIRLCIVGAVHERALADGGVERWSACKDHEVGRLIAAARAEQVCHTSSGGRTHCESLLLDAITVPSSTLDTVDGCGVILRAREDTADELAAKVDNASTVRWESEPAKRPAWAGSGGKRAHTWAGEPTTFDDADGGVL